MRMFLLALVASVALVFISTAVSGILVNYGVYRVMADNGCAMAMEHKETHKGHSDQMETDPVCLMEVDPAKAQNIYEYKGKKYYFCMKEDMEKFKKDPDKYLRRPQAPKR